MSLDGVTRTDAQVSRLDIAQVRHTNTHDVARKTGHRRSVEHPLTVSLRRWPLLRHISRRLLAPSINTPQLEQHTNRSPCGRIPDLDMPCTGNRSAFPRAVEQSALSSRTSHPHCTDSAGHASRILGGHLTVHPAYVVGRMDQSGGYYPHHWILSGHMRHAKNAREQEGSKEADCGECGNEWCKLLRHLEPESSHGRGTTSTSHYWYNHRDGG